MLSGMARYRKGKRGGSRSGQRSNEYRGNWKEIQRENANWEKYYREQNLIPESEFELFKKTCEQHLPLTFRVTGTHSHANEVKHLFETKHLPALSDPKNAALVEDYQPPKAFSWYPNNLGWQIDLPKTVIKKNEDYAKTQRYLVIETDVGNISRQEAVSMIPPLVLDILPHHSVLDMCAAPGSKTAQLVEALHANDDVAAPSGFVMANDSDYRRSHMLVHQVKRLNSANFIVVNHDAQQFPKVKMDDGSVLKFDRVLCDVPCSGDATMRKNINVWENWSVGNALGLHPLQVNILIRGLQCLKPGGRLVYSTCSLSPIENEAVVAAALRKIGNSVSTVNCQDRLPGLKRANGVSTWKVFGKDMEEKQRGEDPKAVDSCYPPTAEEAAEFHLENCMRVYPHYQNTGGFFITVFEKAEDETSGKKRSADVDEVAAKKQKVKQVETAGDAENAGKADNDIEDKEAQGAMEPQPPLQPQPEKQKPKKMPRDAIEEPFIFLPPDHPQLTKCWDFYGIGDEFAKDSTLVRNATGEPQKAIYYVSPAIKSILQNNDTKLKTVYTGVKMFVLQRTDFGEGCPWRTQNECLGILQKYISPERQFVCNLEVLLVLLKESFPNLMVLKEQKLDPAFVEQMEQTGEGCCFLNVKRDDPAKEDLFLPLWRGKNNVNLMVAKQETFELMYRIYGIETDKNCEYKQKPKTEEVTEESGEQPEEVPVKESSPAEEPKVELKVETEQVEEA